MGRYTIRMRTPASPASPDRRRFLTVASTALTVLVSGCSWSRSEATADEGAPDGSDISPTEDLMREHGLLDRLLLVYEECLRREEMPWSTVASTAHLIHIFIQDYHEKLEEDHLFTRLEAANREVVLVATLRTQHRVGRTLTSRIEHISSTSPRSDPDRQLVVGSIAQFIRMYRPHAAHEDTVLFPVFRSLISDHEYDSLGELFDAREQELFGSDGFQGVLAQVVALERTVGINDLAHMTPVL